MTREHAVCNGTTVQRKAKMGTAIVEGEYASRLVDEQNRTAAAPHHQAPLLPQLGQSADANHAVDGLVHGWKCGTALGSSSREKKKRTGPLMERGAVKS